MVDCSWNRHLPQDPSFQNNETGLLELGHYFMIALEGYFYIVL